MGPKGANTILSWKDLVNPKMIRFDEEGSLETTQQHKEKHFVYHFSPLLENFHPQLEFAVDSGPNWWRNEGENEMLK